MIRIFATCGDIVVAIAAKQGTRINTRVIESTAQVESHRTVTNYAIDGNRIRVCRCLASCGRAVMTGVATLAEDYWTTVVDICGQETYRGVAETAIFCAKRIRVRWCRIIYLAYCNSTIMATLADTLNTAVIKAAVRL